MSAPRYRPASYTSEPQLFGKALTLDWPELDPAASSSTQDQARASLRQHHMAFRIQDAVRRQHGSVQEYASVYGINYQRLTGMLRGVVVMRLEDVANAERNLGIKL